jgi:DNA-binding MarR family transcriptional regulator
VSPGGPSPAVSVWVRLLRVHGLVLPRVRRAVPAGLTLPQFDVLAQLQRHPRGLTPGELSRALLVTGGNVTGVVARLLRLGLVERRAVPADRRRVRLRLTGRGRATMRRAVPRHRSELEAIFAPVAPAALARLRDALGEALARLEET